MPVIKRYANRKLYDPGAKQYVTLDDLAGMVRREEDIQVIDHQTGEDLTTTTLLQVVFEEEKRIGGLLPQVMLTRLIRTGGTAFREMREAIYAFLDPAGYVEQDIRKRLERLVALDRLSTEESDQIEGLLLDAELDQESEQQEQVSVDQIEELMREVLRLEKALEELENGARG